MKKTLSILLLLCMVFSLMPMSAFADEAAATEEPALTELTAEEAAEPEAEQETEESAEQPAEEPAEESAEEPTEEEPTEEPVLTAEEAPAPDGEATKTKITDITLDFPIYLGDTVAALKAAIQLPEGCSDFNLEVSDLDNETALSDTDTFNGYTVYAMELSFQTDRYVYFRRRCI